MTGIDCETLEHTLTYRRYKAYHAEWEANPPLPVLMKALAKVKSKKPSPAFGGKKYGKLEELLQVFPTGKIS